MGMDEKSKRKRIRNGDGKTDEQRAEEYVTELKKKWPKVRQVNLMNFWLFCIVENSGSQIEVLTIRF